MREFIRHPTQIPIDYSEPGGTPFIRESVKNVNTGGLCFHSHQYLAPQKEIEITIRCSPSPFCTRARVRWCRSCGLEWEVGVQFETAEQYFCIRMVEQICHIEDYRTTILQCEGRVLGSEEAALEWINRYAAQFPT